MNPLQRLHPEFGQSVWLDFISRKLLESGELKKLVSSEEIRGVTSNPAIFEKAIDDGVDYGPMIAKIQKEKPKASAFEVYETLAVREIQVACDAMKPVYDKSKARDGYVSLEVTMIQGKTTKHILEEARRLWAAVARPNVMIKVPATPDGIAAFEELIVDGFNVNVTLLFAVEAYAKVAKAYVSGLEKRAKKGGDVSRIGSVASFFVSRIDSNIDKQLEGQLAKAKTAGEKAEIQALMGRAAIANAKVAYAEYKKIFSGKKWEALAKAGAQTQRVLWASTGTKNKAYSDVMYVDELIGPDTVNTAPPATVDAFRDHGQPSRTLDKDVEAATARLAALEKRGIALKSVTDQLLVEGLKSFDDAFAKLLETMKSRLAGGAPGKAEGASGASAAFAPLAFVAPKEIASAIANALDDWKKHKKVERLWARDAMLWTNADEAKWLGWLDAPTNAAADAAELAKFASEIKKSGFKHVLLLGMGGSSLCPEVLKLTFGSEKGFPTLEVLDSTDPAQIATIEGKVDLAKTLFLVASKSGSTLEPNIFEAYFWERARQVVGEKDCGPRFICVTDPGSKLEGVAKKKGYRRIFPGNPAIGGRFSALSNFGMVPAALIGLDLARYTQRALAMAGACGAANPPESNPGLQLGAVLGVAARHGRDKVTLVTSRELASLGAWLEQLLAESTGKIGKGIVPVDLEPLAAPGAYGNDRVFVHVKLQGATDKAQDAAIDALEKAGHVVARIVVADKLDIGAEFFRWEFATAVAGSIQELNTFDQPDVEASKIVTKELTSAYEKSGSLPGEKAFFEEKGVLLYADGKYAKKLFQATGAHAQLTDVLAAHLAQVKAGDYFALLAYVEMNATNVAEMSAIRLRVRDTLKIATCLGFGPRFLHSTGQAYKGGPNSGVFLQVTCADPADLAVPGAKYTFGVVKAAQARGDFQVLVERGRRALRFHVSGDLKAGIATLKSAMTQALSKPAHTT